MYRNIASLPKPYEHESCSVCGSANTVLVIQGGSPAKGTNCYYCGNTVILCSTCVAQMLGEMYVLDVIKSL